jgi:hypothetical protein
MVTQPQSAAMQGDRAIPQQPPRKANADKAHIHVIVPRVTWRVRVGDPVWFDPDLRAFQKKLDVTVAQTEDLTRAGQNPVPFLQLYDRDRPLEWERRGQFNDFKPGGPGIRDKGGTKGYGAGKGDSVKRVKSHPTDTKKPQECSCGFPHKI